MSAAVSEHVSLATTGGEHAAAKRIVAAVISADVLQRYGSGNWKDFHGVNDLLTALGVEVRVVPHVNGAAASVLAACAAGATDVLMHYSIWPDLLQSVREKYPQVRIHTRMHNPEPLQYLQRNPVGWLPTHSNARRCYGAARMYANDWRSRRLSDSLLWISDWDQARYQPLLLGAAKGWLVPYHCPWPAKRPRSAAVAWDQRRAVIACLPGGRDRIGLAQIEGLRTLAAQLAGIEGFEHWQLELSTGTMRRHEARPLGSPFVDAGDVAEPWDYLLGVKAVALLSGLGYGCKTTLIDALAAGCHVLVAAELAQRLPAAVRSQCIVVGGKSARPIQDIFSALQQPPAVHDVHALRSEQAKAGLRNALQL